VRRLLATVRRDVTLQIRYRLYAVSVFVVLVWGVLLSLLPVAARTETAVVVPAFVVFNLIVTTFYFVGALVLLERDEGMLSAIVTTPLRDAEYLLSKAITLTALATAESLLVVLLLFGARFRWDLLLAGTVLLGALYVLAGFLAVARHDSLNEWLLPSVPVLLFLMLPLLGHFGLVDRRLFWLHPVAPALLLLQAACDPSSTGEIAFGVLGSVIWLGAGFTWARHRFDRYLVREAGS
jgi:fluoroquinolone transport system permease protein